MKRFVAWVINSVNQGRSRLGFKLFLGIFLTLFTLFWLSFGLATALIPELYVRQFTTRFETFIIEFGSEIADLPLEEIINEIDRFAAYNNALVTLSSQEEVVYTINAITLMDNTSPLIDASWMFRQDPLTGAEFTISAQTHLDHVLQIRELLQRLFYALLIGVFFVSLVVSYLVSASVADPIIKLSRMAKKLEQLDLSLPFDVKRADEIGALSHHLHAMAKKLDATLTDLHVANAQLQNEINLKERQEAQKRDLFTALSHELKTPLVVLKGELEGMIKQVGVYQDRDTYLQKAYDTADSMTTLIQEILLVSRLESNAVTLHFAPLNLGHLVNKTCENYEDFAALKRISLLYYCEDDLMVLADRFQIQTVLSNLINNAITHSAKKEMVWIQLVRENEKGILTVKNKGHLPPVDLAHLFDPFYRVEKSRNRHSGGSGLGLFIVKRILQLHGFDCHVTNEKNFVVFTVTFDLDEKENPSCCN